MKKSAYSLIAILILGMTLWLFRKPLYQFIVTEHVNKKIPEFTLQSLDGSVISSTDFKGKVLVLDFWTTWCGLCISSFPEFQGVFDSYAKNPRIVFLAINTGQGGDSFEKVRKYVDTKQFTFPFAYDTDSVLSESLKIKYYPTLMIVDGSSRIRLKHIGYSKCLEDYGSLLNYNLIKVLDEGQISK